MVRLGPDDDDPVPWPARQADAVVTTRDDVALAVHGADCAIVGLVADEGVVGAAHAGWRGLVAGVLPAAADAMRELGATERRGPWLGPCIGPECYEFGAEALDGLVGELGSRGPGHDLPRAPPRSIWRRPWRGAASAPGSSWWPPPAACTACAADDAVVAPGPGRGGAPGPAGVDRGAEGRS